MRVDEPGESGGSGRVLVGYGTASPPERRRQGTRRVMPPASSVGDGKGRHSLAEAGRPLAKPPVRKLAKDLGVDLETVTPTGSEGTITRDDVRRAASGQHAATGARSVDGYATERVEFTGVRGRVAEQTTRSRREIPSATARVSAEASELLATRDALAAAHPDLEISPLAVLLRIVVAGLREVGVLNAHVEEGGGALLRHRAIHLGVAVHTDRGLLVPVIRDAEQRSTIELARELGRVVDGARDASLAPAELSGSTFTVSNYGSLGIDGGDPVINPPEVGILGVGRIAARPWVVDGRVAVRPSVELALAFDHRACDGADAAAFLRLLAACLQDRTALVASL